jgi:hypothetical protein
MSNIKPHIKYLSQIQKQQEYLGIMLASTQTLRQQNSKIKTKKSRENKKENGQHSREKKERERAENSNLRIKQH